MRKEVGFFKIDGKPCRLIQLTKGFWMIVDAADYEMMMRWEWHVAVNRSGKHYAAKGGKPRKIYAHQFLLPLPKGIEVDHDNGNTLDNRRENLRPATKKQNNCNVGVTSLNTSGLKGVSKWGESFRSQIRANGRNKSLGYYATAKEAHMAWCYAAVFYHGQFANCGCTPSCIDKS